MQQPRIVSHEEWLAARERHLKNEKALTRMRDMVAADRRALPWVKVEKNYVFDTVEGRKTLGQLFGPNSQLIIQHSCGATIWARAASAARSIPITPRVP